MTKSIYTNGAVAKLTAPITATSLSVIVDNGSNFPMPLAGSEGFWMTLVGNVSQVVEIVRVTARNGNVMSVTRGQEGTVAQAFTVDDQAYHALTADDATSFRDAMEYYLGAHDVEPTVGNSGEPLKSGMLYFNTTINEMREFNGTAWQNFAAIVSLAGLAESMWDAHPFTTNTLDPVIWPSENGDAAPAFDVKDTYQVYVDGERLLNATDPNIDGGFKVVDNAGTVEIQLIAVYPAPFRLSVVQATLDTGNHIDKGEETAAGWSSLATQAEVDSGEVGKLVSADTGKVYSDSGDASQQAYSDQVLVDANAYADQVLADAKAYADSSSKGLKNIILNGMGLIAQRSDWSGTWGVDMANGEYGEDRWLWLSALATHKVQYVESVNMLAGQPYSMQWVGGGTGYIYDANAALVASGVSPLEGFVINDTSGATSVHLSVPHGSTFIQFERGLKSSSYEHRNYGFELSLCQRYYWEQPPVQIFGHDNLRQSADPSIATDRSVIVNFPVPMRISPTITETLVGWAGAVAAPTQDYVRYSGLADAVGSTSTVRDIKADAEIYP